VRLHNRIQRAEAAQHGGGQAMGGGAVASVGRWQTVQRILQRPVLLEDGLEKGKRERAGWVHRRGLWRSGAADDRAARRALHIRII
jgi:hypothetical protein